MAGNGAHAVPRTAVKWKLFYVISSQGKILNYTEIQIGLFWRFALESNDTRMKRFGHNNRCYIWRKKGKFAAWEHSNWEVRGGSIML